MDLRLGNLGQGIRNLGAAIMGGSKTWTGETLLELARQAEAFGIVNIPSTITNPADYKTFLAVPEKVDLIQACIRKMMTDIGRVPVEVWERDERGLIKMIPGHPAAEFLRAFDAVDTYVELFELTVGQILAAGETFWVFGPIKADGSALAGRPQWIKVIEPYMIQILQAEPGSIAARLGQTVIGYQYSPTGTFGPSAQVLPIEAVIHFREVRIAGSPRGWPRYIPWKREINIEDARQRFQEALFKNGARPDLALVFEGQMPKPEELERMMKAWDSRHQGPNKAGRPAAVGGKIKDVKILGQSNKDLDLSTLSKMTREKICSMWPIAPVLLGYSEGINRANAEIEEKIYWEGTPWGVMNKIAAKLTQNLLPLFGGKPGQYMAFNLFMVPVLRDALLDQSKILQRFDGIGIPPNKVLPLTGLPLDLGPAGDVSYRQMALALVDQETGELTPAAQDTATPAGDLARTFSRVDKNLELLKAAVVKKKEPTGDWKTLKWETWVKTVLDPSEAKIKKQARAYFDGLGRRVSANLENLDQEADDLLDPKKEAGHLNRLVAPAIVGALALAARQELRDQEVPITQSALGVINRVAETWGADHWGGKVTGINDETARLINGIMAVAQDRGATVAETRAAILETVGDGDLARAERIARTEGIGAASVGQQTAFEISGVEKKGWIAERDQWTRDSHNQAAEDYGDGREIPIDEDFEVGDGAGPGPGLISSDRENINCRCVMYGVAPTEPLDN